MLQFLSCNELQQEVDDRLYGVWNSIGYGQQLEISKRSISIRDTYESGCNLNTKLPIKYLEEFYSINNLTKDSLQVRVGFTNYDFVRSRETEICKKKQKQSPNEF